MDDYDDFVPLKLADHLHQALDNLLTQMVKQTSLGGEVMVKFSDPEIAGVGAEVFLRVMVTPTLFGERVGSHEWQGEEVVEHSPPVRTRDH